MVPGLLQLRAAFRRDRIDRGPKRSDGKACFSVPAPRPGGYPPACRRAFLRMKKPRARHFRERNICRCRRNACRSQKEYPGLKTFARPRFGAGGVLFCPCFDPAGRSRRGGRRPPGPVFPGPAKPPSPEPRPSGPVPAQIVKGVNPRPQLSGYISARRIPIAASRKNLPAGVEERGDFV